jgi:NAD(P)H-dependent FMN reductase
VLAQSVTEHNGETAVTAEVNLLGVVGSPSSDPVSAALVGTVLAEAKARGAATRLLDLRSAPLPLFDPERPGNGTAAKARELVVWADAFALGTPDYHGAPSGIIKNFMDHFWKEFAGKLFGIVVSSYEKGLTVQDHLRTSVRQCYGWSLPYGIGASPEAVDGGAAVVDAAVRVRLAMMARDLFVYGSLLRGQRLADLAGPRQSEVSGFMARMHLD